MQSNFFKMNFRGSMQLVLIVKSSSYLDTVTVIHVQYYSKANRARKLVCV